MIAYNREWLDTLATTDAAKEWHKKGLLSDEKLQAIQAQNTSNFYTPNIFVRIGLAVFGFILMLAVMGLAGLISKLYSEAMFGLFWGIVWIAALDFWAIKTARHFGSGIDDIMLYMGVSIIITSLCSLLLSYSAGTLSYCIIAWPFLLAGSIRYADRLMAASTFICSLMIVLLIVNKIPSVALYLLPFTGMTFSAAAYFFARRAQQNYEWRYWSGLFAVTELLALVAFYASGNYWVVQQVAYGAFAIPQPPFGWFFWIFTLFLPAIYIYEGFTRKDRLMMDVGLVCAGAAVFTFRYYFHLLPWTWLAVVAGAGLFVTAYFSIRHLLKHAGAYTYEADGNESMLQQAEEQLIEQTIASQVPSAPARNDSPGGGQFGGGGAGGDY